jgi:hypothetical protein
LGNLETTRLLWKAELKLETPRSGIAIGDNTTRLLKAELKLETPRSGIAIGDNTTRLLKAELKIQRFCNDEGQLTSQ